MVGTGHDLPKEPTLDVPLEGDLRPAGQLAVGGVRQLLQAQVVLLCPLQGRIALPTGVSDALVALDAHGDLALLLFQGLDGALQLRDGLVQRLQRHLLHPVQLLRQLGQQGGLGLHLGVVVLESLPLGLESLLLEGVPFRGQGLLGEPCLGQRLLQPLSAQGAQLRHLGQLRLLGLQEQSVVLHLLPVVVQPLACRLQPLPALVQLLLERLDGRLHLRSGGEEQAFFGLAPSGVGGGILAVYGLQLRPLLGQQGFQLRPLGLQLFQFFLRLGALLALGFCLGDGLFQLGELGGGLLLAAL